MTEGSVATRIYDIMFREFPHRAKTGLFPIGVPDADSPVLVTGNYTETVRRMRKVLKGLDVWLLIANSKGINVWCAAGGGHLTHHDVISALVTSGASEKVQNRTLILPQLSATGIERKKITDATGWKASWGPVMLQDIPEFLQQGHKATPAQRLVRFTFHDRMEMATLWSVPMILIGMLMFALLGGIIVGVSVAVAAAVISYGIFSTIPWIWVNGRKKWITFSTFATVGILASWIVLFAFGETGDKQLILSALGGMIEMGSLSVDLAGTTPLYGSYINTFRNHAHIDLIQEKCNGSADCITVCPKEVFRLSGSKHKVDIISGEKCIECGACIVQCPQDALRFKYDNGRIVDPSTIRKTRMNMMGRRTIEVTESTTK